MLHMPYFVRIAWVGFLKALLVVASLSYCCYFEAQKRDTSFRMCATLRTESRPAALGRLRKGGLLSKTSRIAAYDAVLGRSMSH